MVRLRHENGSRWKVTHQERLSAVTQRGAGVRYVERITVYYLLNCLGLLILRPSRYLYTSPSGGGLRVKKRRCSGIRKDCMFLFSPDGRYLNSTFLSGWVAVNSMCVQLSHAHSYKDAVEPAVLEWRKDVAAAYIVVRKLVKLSGKYCVASQNGGDIAALKTGLDKIENLVKPWTLYISQHSQFLNNVSKASNFSRYLPKTHV